MLRDTRITTDRNDPYAHIYTKDFWVAHEWLSHLEEHPTHGHYDNIEDFIVFHIKKEYVQA